MERITVQRRGQATVLLNKGLSQSCFGVRIGWVVRVVSGGATRRAARRRRVAQPKFILAAGIDRIKAGSRR